MLQRSPAIDNGSWRAAARPALGGNSQEFRPRSGQDHDTAFRNTLISRFCQMDDFAERKSGARVPLGIKRDGTHIALG